jgi:hypothetical protein
MVVHLVKKFPAFYGTRKFITVFTRAHQGALSRDNQNKNNNNLKTNHLKVGAEATPEMLCTSNILQTGPDIQLWGPHGI